MNNFYSVRYLEYTLSSDIKNWLKSSIKNFWYVNYDRRNRLFLYFKCQEDAVLFKLTWG